MKAFLLAATATALAPLISSAYAETAADARAAFEAYVHAINTADAEAAAAFYDRDPDFHWIEQGQLRYTDAADAAESMKGLLSVDGTPQMTVNDVLIADLGESAALVTANFDFAMLGPDGQPRFSFGGWMSVAMIAREDGWKIAAGQSGPETSD